MNTSMLMLIRGESDLTPHITNFAETEYLAIKAKISTQRPKDHIIELEENHHVSQMANDRPAIIASEKHEAKKDEPEPAKPQQVLPAEPPKIIQAVPDVAFTVLPPNDPAVQDNNSSSAGLSDVL